MKVLFENIISECCEEKKKYLAFLNVDEIKSKNVAVIINFILSDNTERKKIFQGPSRTLNRFSNNFIDLLKILKTMKFRYKINFMSNKMGIYFAYFKSLSKKSRVSSMTPSKLILRIILLLL